MAANVNVKFSVEVAFSSSDPLYIVGGYFGKSNSRA